MEIVLNIFIVSYLLFCFLWYQNFNVKLIYHIVGRLGLDHAWPMFVSPQLYNITINCHLQFKDGNQKTFQFNNNLSNSLIHRKFIDSLETVDHLKIGLTDYLLHFSGIENLKNVRVEIVDAPIEDYNEAWKEYRIQYENE